MTNFFLRIVPLIVLAACGSVAVSPTYAPVVPLSQSVEQADASLEQARRERAAAEADYAASERICYAKFFVNNCLDKAKEKRRLVLNQARAVEVEAERFKRKASVDERDRKLAEAEKEELERQAKLAAELAAAPPKAAPAEAAPPTPASVTLAERQARQDAKLKKQAAKDKAEAAQRAAKAAAFAKKRLDSEQRQRDIAAKKMEKAENEGDGK
ncbi:MAG: hypothetical protein V4463_15930 [Pseudomonadota bacterium]